MNKKISLSFAVDADSVSLRSICKKDFLELQMRAISTANPNLNGSWFTRESLVGAIESCKNKPILGYFNADGDFESHNGTWRKDVETGLDYWDTSNGEQMLGLIRESDEAKVVDGDDGLSWLCISCALWTQYNFKQVKRLFKDAKKAKENGGVTKNISVEIDILEGEKQENGVYRIDKFNLLGITILGSRNGRKVEPGIANAALSIPDIMGTDFYARQERALRVAYSRLDNTEGENTEREDISPMEKKTMEMSAAAPAADTVTASMAATDGNPVSDKMEAEGTEGGEEAKATCEGTCPVCNHDPCICEMGCGSEKLGGDGDDDHDDDHDDDDHDDGHDDDGHDDGHGDGEGHEGDGCDGSCGKEGCESGCKGMECGGNATEEEGSAPADASVAKCSTQDGEKSEIRDVAWLVSQSFNGYGMINDTLKYYTYMVENYPEDKVSPHAAYIISVLRRCAKYEQLVQGTLAGLLAKIAGEITEADESYEARISNYDIGDKLVSDYEDAMSRLDAVSRDLEGTTRENESLREELGKYTKAEFLGKVSSLISSANIGEEVGKSIYEACKDGTISSYDDAKVRVALAALDAKKPDNISQVSESGSPAAMAPVDTPNTHAAFEGKAEKPSTRSPWDVLHSYISK